MVIGLTYIILVSQTQLLRRPAFHGRDCLLPFAFLTSSQQLIREMTKPSLVLLFFSIHKLIFHSCGYILYSPCLSQLNILFIIIRPLYCLFILVCPLNVPSPPPLPSPTPLHVSGQHHLLRESKSFVQTMSTLCLWIIKWAPGHSFIHPFNQLLTE